MALRFQCPNCKIIRQANQRLMGREIKCPECGSPVQLPTLEQVAATKRSRQIAEQEEREFRAALGRLATQPPTPMAALVEPNEEEEQARMSAEERALAAASTNFTRPKPPSGEDMDMTPMVDVTFLLLIFFMITASFSVQKSIQQPAQKDDPSSAVVEIPPDQDPNTVTVQVDEFNAYSVITGDWDRVAGSKQDLIVALNDAHAGNASGNQPTKLFVQAHENCIHAAVVAALDAGREAQFESFQVSTVEQFD